MNSESPALKRSLSLPVLTLYGLGNILGAGIYVLIGKVVATAGMYAPWSFLIASLIAGFTGLCTRCRIYCFSSVSGLPVSSRSQRIIKGGIPGYAASFIQGG